MIPFLKVVNDAAVAVNQGGKRKGAVCAYLEAWHLDIEEFLDLRKNTGDDRRRTHDMNTAAWIPDLFMQRVEEDGHWTLFSPERRARPARPLRPGLRAALRRVRGRGRPGRDQPAPARRGGRALAQDADARCSRLVTRGSPSRTRPTSAARRTTPASSTTRTSAPRSCSTPAATRWRSATSARSTCRRTSRDGQLDAGAAGGDGPDRRCGCSTT